MPIGLTVSSSVRTVARLGPRAGAAPPRAASWLTRLASSRWPPRAAAVLLLSCRRAGAVWPPLRSSAPLGLASAPLLLALASAPRLGSRWRRARLGSSSCCRGFAAPLLRSRVVSLFSIYLCMLTASAPSAVALHAAGLGSAPRAGAVVPWARFGSACAGAGAPRFGSASSRRLLELAPCSSLAGAVASLLRSQS